MRILLDILGLCLVLGLLFTIGRGFPQFGHLLRLLLLSPIGWILLLGIGFCIYRLRQRRPKTGPRP